MKTFLKKKTLIYFVTELAFILINYLYLFLLQSQYLGSNPYQNHLVRVLYYLIPFLSLLMGPLLGKIFVFIFNGAISLYLIAQSIYFKAFGQYFRFAYAVSLIDEVIGVKSSAEEFYTIKDFSVIIVLGIITLIFIIFYFLYERKLIKFKYKLIISLASLLFLIPAFLDYRGLTKELEASRETNTWQPDKTDYYIYDTIPSSNQFVEKLGLLTFMERDLKSLSEKTSFSEEDYKEVADYLALTPNKQENMMTDVFKGKNVIFIQAESFVDIALDKELTPTLYRLKHDGINIEDFNTPLPKASTSDTEIMTNTSLIPESDSYASCYEYQDNYFPQTLPTLFESIGYDTFAFHNNYGEYYNRTVMFNTLGYDKFFDCTGLGLEDTPPDDEIMEQIGWILVERENNWMTYWITYSGHQPYAPNEVGVSEKNVERIKEKYPNLPDEYVYYMAKNMDLDSSIARFMDIFDWNGKLNEVVFVFYGDHQAKGLDFTEESPIFSGMNIDYYNKAKNTDLFIYCADYGSMNYKKTSTVLDLLPTISNMFGIDYDEKIALGRDIFDERYHGFYFGDFGYTGTDDFGYDYIADKITLTNPEYTEAKAEEDLNYYNQKRVISKKILQMDYFKPENK
ncbi:MAG: sulfatase-like hydrolase/transferase [Erysipelotrichaceae bacterium]|nr:sulfatase-like hydrolase/transferase [Erysipelotrichaceae bacterium]